MAGFIREPAVSGIFYPNNPRVLRTEALSYIGNAKVDPVRGEIKGLVVPHAGYMYSGQVAAYGFKTLKDRPYDTVILIAPSHRAYFDGVAVQESGGYRTPLGVVEIDEEMARSLTSKRGIIRTDERAHRDEHAIEVQLPFLQIVLNNFRLVPLLMGVHDTASCRDLSSLLVGALKGTDRRAVIIASSDLSHYYPYDSAVTRDSVIIGHLERFSPQALLEDLSVEKAEACGGSAIAAAMIACEQLGADASKVLKYANSGDVTADRSSVVGYLSCVFYRRQGGGDGENNG